MPGYGHYKFISPGLDNDKLTNSKLLAVPKCSSIEI